MKSQLITNTNRKRARDKDFKLYFDRGVVTDRTIHHNRPDIIIIDKKKRETVIMDVAVPLNVTM